MYRHIERHNGLNGKPLVSIISAGMSKFGKHEGLLAREIFGEAASEAFESLSQTGPKTGHQSHVYRTYG